jgi:hypothetical protein
LQTSNAKLVRTADIRNIIEKKKYGPDVINQKQFNHIDIIYRHFSKDIDNIENCTAKINKNKNEIERFLKEKKHFEAEVTKNYKKLISKYINELTTKSGSDLKEYIVKN